MPDPNPAVDPKQLFNSFVQIGVVVADVDQSTEALTRIFGIGPFRTLDWPPPDRADMAAQRLYYGQHADFTARMAFADLGSIEIELIQPVSGDSIWADFLRDRGGGIHHIRFNVPDMDPVITYLAGQDISPAQQGLGIRPGTSWCNFDTNSIVGFTIEVMKALPGTTGRTPMFVDGKVQANS
jgi:methylmalonyl-CoA/ethylmalonyl-CoA epimerase